MCKIKFHDDNGKLNGTLIKVKNENNEEQRIYVCSQCQNQDNWIEKAKIKGA